MRKIFDVQITEEQGLPSWATESHDSRRRKSDTVILEVRYHDVTFEDLQLISELYGTRNINVGSEAREGGYCDTCRHSYSITIITVMDVTKRP